MDEKWLKDIENQLTDYEAVAPAGLWEGIDAKLKGGRTRSLRPLMFRIAAAVLLCLMVGGALLLLPEQQVTQPHSLAVHLPSMQPEQDQQQVDSLPSAAIPASTPFTLLASVSHQTASAQPATPVALQDVHQSADAHLLHSDASSGPHRRSDASSPSPSEQPEATQRSSSQSASPQRSAVQCSSLTRSPSQQHKPLRVSLLATNMLADNSTSNGPGGAALMSSGTSPAHDPVKNPLHTGYGAMDKHLIGNDGARIYDQEKHHKLPVRVGVSLSYSLTNRLSIGFGLCYSYLSSDFKTGSERNYQSAHQSLHYIGLPVNVSYTFHRTSRFSFYATGGLMAEKCVSGRSELLTVSGNSREVEKQSLTEKHLQYSTFGSVGAQMDLTKHVGLYLEPGLSFYFDNHSRVVNIYKDNPLQFNLSAGVRFSF